MPPEPLSSEASCACSSSIFLVSPSLRVVRDANMRQQFAGGSSSRRPELESRTTPGLQRVREGWAPDRLGRGLVHVRLNTQGRHTWLSPMNSREHSRAVRCVRGKGGRGLSLSLGFSPTTGWVRSRCAWSARWRRPACGSACRSSAPPPAASPSRARPVGSAEPKR